MHINNLPELGTSNIDGFTFDAHRFEHGSAESYHSGYFVMAFNDNQQSIAFRIILSKTDDTFQVDVSGETAPEKLTIDLNNPSKLLLDALKALGYINDDRTLTKAFRQVLNPPKHWS